jgi:hypothetical protein
MYLSDVSVLSGMCAVSAYLSRAAILCCLLLLLLLLLQTGQQLHGPLTPPASPPWQIEAAILKLHSRRVCCLTFPDNSECCQLRVVVRFCV